MADGLFYFWIYVTLCLCTKVKYQKNWFILFLFILFCEYPSDDPIQQVDINNVNISSSIALSKDGAIYELQTK